MTTDNDAGTDKAQTIRRFFDAIVAGDSATLLEILTPDAVTRWPQSGERMTGALSCVRVHENYPGGPPSYEFGRISGAGDTWVAERTLMYGEEPWYSVSIVEFDDVMRSNRREPRWVMSTWPLVSGSNEPG